MIGFRSDWLELTTVEVMLRAELVWNVRDAWGLDLFDENAVLVGKLEVGFTPTVEVTLSCRALISAWLLSLSDGSLASSVVEGPT